MGVPGLLPLAQQAGAGLRSALDGRAAVECRHSVLQGNGLLQLQLLFLDGGLLLSLYLVWRMAAGTRVVRRLLAVAPLALLADRAIRVRLLAAAPADADARHDDGCDVRRLVVALMLACAAAAAHARWWTAADAAGCRTVCGVAVYHAGVAGRGAGRPERDGGRAGKQRGSAGCGCCRHADSRRTPASAPVVAHLSHAHATNRLLEDAVVQLPHAGRWHAVIHVREAGREASVRPI